jgi:6,7-dimethyl-8-ribityllumazine synthase
MPKKPHILIVEARFYDEIADHLLAAVRQTLTEAGASYETISVPGALEIPAAIKQASRSQKFDGYIALGCVIRGETYHFEIVSNESARGLMDLAVHDGLVIGNGILTCETWQQAVVRADPAQKNKGGEAAMAMLAVLQIQQQFQG